MPSRHATAMGHSPTQYKGRREVAEITWLRTIMFFLPYLSEKWPATSTNRAFTNPKMEKITPKNSIGVSRLIKYKDRNGPYRFIATLRSMTVVQRTRGFLSNARISLIDARILDKTRGLRRMCLPHIT